MTENTENLKKTPAGPDNPDSLRAQFSRAVRNMRGVIFIERAIPRILPPLYTGGLFLSASWAGLWAPLPVEARIAGVIGFATALVMSPLFAKSGSLLVRKDDALRRMDDRIGDPSRPAQSFDDTLSDFHPDNSKALWDLHQNRLWDKWGHHFKADRPQIDFAARDPYRLRYAVSLALVMTAFMAGGQHMDRVKDAFDWTKAPTAEEIERQQASLRIRAWITPPDHMDMPPIPYLDEKTPGNAQGEDRLIAHQTSLLTIILTGEERKIRLNGVDVELQKIVTPEGQDKRDGKAGGLNTYYYEMRLNDENSVVTIENGPEWHFDVTQDHAPVTSINEIRPNDNNIQTLDINCSAQDDFGVIEGEIRITLPDEEQDPEATPLPSGSIHPVPLPAPCTPR